MVDWTKWHRALPTPIGNLVTVEPEEGAVPAGQTTVNPLGDLFVNDRFSFDSTRLP